MHSSNGDAIRRTNASKKKTTRTNYIVNGDNTSRRKDRRKRNRRLQEERNRRAALVFFASFVFIAAILFLCLRPRQPHYGSVDSERYARAKALRDAALSGGEMMIGGLKGTKKWNSYSGKPDFLRNSKGPNGIRYSDPRQLPPLPGEANEPYFGKGRKHHFRGDGDDEWQAHDAAKTNSNHGPKVDYTKHKYEYPELMLEPPNDDDGGTYPTLERMMSIFETWGQDDLDSPPETLVEVLQHFDYQDPEQLNVSIFVSPIYFTLQLCLISAQRVVFTGCNQV
jgi:hypothetical protein